MSFFDRVKEFISYKSTTNSLESPSLVYRVLFDKLRSDALGCGRDVHTPGRDAHWPSAYALIASSEFASRNHVGGKNFKAHNYGACVSWLIGNVGCSSTRAPLWGVPYPRKIWEDKESVLEGTAFCVPTCHSIQALLEIAFDPDSHEVLRYEAKKCAEEAARYYVNNCFDEAKYGIVYWYSPLEQHSFHVTNATAMMAGQIQRCANAFDCDDLRKSSDSAVAYLMAIKENINGIIGWNYFGEKIPEGKKNRTNDLLHEAFVCNGLLDYKEFGGTISDSYTFYDLYWSLGKFFRDGAIYEYSNMEKIASRKRLKARVWAIGHALYVISRLERKISIKDEEKLSTVFFRELCQHYFDGKNLYYRPKETIVNERVREIGHVLLGLSEYIEADGLNCNEIA